MTVETFMAMLFTVSVVNSLVTEAVKKCLDTFDKKYPSNILAGIVSVCIGGFMCYGHAMFSAPEVNELLILSYIAFVVMSWVCAMVGYDKVVQAVKQITGSDKV